MWRNLSVEFAKGAKRGMASTVDDWRALPVHLMNGAIMGLVWGPGDHQLAAATLSGTSILNQSVLHRKHSENYSIVQVNENEVLFIGLVIIKIVTKSRSKLGSI